MRNIAYSVHLFALIKTFLRAKKKDVSEYIFENSAAIIAFRG